MPELMDRLDEADREALLGIGGRWRASRGERLMHEGRPAADVLILLDGRVKVSVTSAAGMEMVLAFRGPGTLLGDLSALDGEPHSASVTAIEDVEALSVPAGAFRALLERRPGIAIALLRLLSSHLRDADRKRAEFAAGDTTARVAARLVDLADEYGRPDADTGTLVDLPLTQEDLAGWCGASLEATGRALRTLREAGWIRTGRKTLVVLDAAALRSRAG